MKPSFKAWLKPSWVDCLSLWFYQTCSLGTNSHQGVMPRQISKSCRPSDCWSQYLMLFPFLAHSEYWGLYDLEFVNLITTVCSFTGKRITAPNSQAVAWVTFCPIWCFSVVLWVKTFLLRIFQLPWRNETRAKCRIYILPKYQSHMATTDRRDFGKACKTKSLHTIFQT